MLAHRMTLVCFQLSTLRSTLRWAQNRLFQSHFLSYRYVIIVIPMKRFHLRDHLDCSLPHTIQLHLT